MHSSAPSLSLDRPLAGCTPETTETPEWPNLLWCIRNVPGDVCRFKLAHHLMKILCFPGLGHHPRHPSGVLFLIRPDGYVMANTKSPSQVKDYLRKCTRK